MGDIKSDLETGQTGINHAPEGQPSTQRKLRPGQRRDLELAQFCQRMAKEASRSGSPADRRDAKFWGEMAYHIEHTDGAGMPLGDRVPKPTTVRLEKIQRAIAFLDAVRDAEVAQLRQEGLSWDGIAQGVAMTREGARRRWSEPA